MIKKSPKNLINLTQRYQKIKLPIIYKILISIAILWGLALFYFIVLVSNSPRSIDFITKKIQKNLDTNFAQKVVINKTFIKFTGYGSFKISASDIAINYQDSQFDEFNQVKTVNKALNIPKIEAEFSLLDFIFLKFNPSKIKIFQPQIIIDNTKNLNKIIDNSIDKSSSESLENEQLYVMISFLSSLRKSKNPIENLEIEDGKIFFHTSKFNSTLIIKTAKISSKINKESLDLSIQSNIFFAKNKSDFKVDSNCKLSKFDGLKCDINVFNFVPNSIVEFNEVFADLKNIDTTVNGLINVSINNDKSLNIVKFNLRADKGSFNYNNFFKDRIDFRNMKIIGEYNGELKIINFSDIQANLISNIADQTEILNPQLNLSLIISMLEDKQTKYDFDIKIKNVLTDEINRFWPLNLSQNGIRDWVLKNINNGFINNASAKFVILETIDESYLQDITAKLDFSNLSLMYDNNFPALKKLNGIAEFSKNSMKIDVDSGSVLDSKITKAEILIEDFNMPINILKIYAKVAGNAVDGLKHVSNNKEFHQQLDANFKGTAESVVEIFLPVNDKIQLKDIYLSINSQLNNVGSSLLNGNVSVITKKDINSNIFNCDIDLTNAKFNQKELKISKEINEKMLLKFSLDLADDKILSFKNVFLGDPDNLNTKLTKKITGSFDLSANNGDLLNLNLSNQNINKNNYTIIFNNDINKSSVSLFVRGKYLDLSEIINKKFSNIDPKKDIKSYKINVAIDNLILANNKNFNRFNLALNCQNIICQSGYIRSSNSKSKKNDKIINVKINKIISEKSNSDSLVYDYFIDGQIQDIGYVLEALNISKLITNGDLKLNIVQKIIDDKIALEGNIKTLSDITIFENEAVKKFSKNDLFSKIKDKIFSSEKTTFSSMIIDFSFKNSEIILKSLIANNFKIGITAKGNINFANNSMDIKGMIIPGYIINSLFGLGKIPVLGGVISGILTGGEGGGIFSIRYEYVKKTNDKEGEFSTNKVSAFVPSSISNLFE